MQPNHFWGRCGAEWQRLKPKCGVADDGGVSVLRSACRRSAYRYIVPLRLVWWVIAKSGCSR